VNDFLDTFPKFIQENITFSWINEKRDAKFVSFPEEIPTKIKSVYRNLGINHLYKHQVDSIQHTSTGKNVVIATGTASGKSLCYQLPILNSIVQNNKSTSLLLFPTKALSADQYRNLHDQIAVLLKSNSDISKDLSIGMYDGDTPSAKRYTIRNKANVIITNPDMLHLGILPHHPSWEKLFSNLKFIVIDEIHTYSGVFGSHFTNVIRRLKRVAQFYDASPQFILTSATIANPKILAERIIEEKFELIDHDYSKQNEKIFAFYNPPIIDSKLGVRKSMFEETYQIAHVLLNQKKQGIIFARTRKTVERLLKRFNTLGSKNHFKLSAYRSGYLKSERRNIEAGLKSGEIDMVISTTALELGIDMGMVDAIILMGYPGSISRFLQQSGRAGRDEKKSLSIMVASSSPLDQFLIKHPEFIKDKNPEKALVDPDNPFIIFNHIKCAAFEIPFTKYDKFGLLEWEQLHEFLSLLENMGVLYHEHEKYFWKSDQYPANDISLRSIFGNPFTLFINKGGEYIRIGEMDQRSAKKMIHPGAIYLHNGQTFVINTLDIKNHLAQLSAFNEHYYTEPIIKVETSIESQLSFENLENYYKGFGEIRIIENVIGFKKIVWDTNEVIGYEELEMGSDELQTKGLWVTFSNKIINHLKSLNLWTNAINEYGSNWKEIREKIIFRDQNTCQFCRKSCSPDELHVHHKIPFRTFLSIKVANQPENLVSLCPACHRIAEKNVRMRSILSGLGYAFSHIAPIFLLCDRHDLGYTFDERIGINLQKPGIIIYDQFPGGIGLSENLYLRVKDVFYHLKGIIEQCPCTDGCPSCVGPPGENGMGAKKGTLELIIKTLHR
jgi:DEAD/DEAH box helicase domain-containing protein